MKPTLQEIPSHLQEFLVDQDYSNYTAIDQACWRYIMRVSQSFFKNHAHPIYVDGLKGAGISIESIPRISEMDEHLRKFGWRAVSITGFIPSEIFLEMLSLQILPIACDIRNLEHIEYTPAPDIVHEAAGHAPILADPSYSSFLRKFGEIARWVIFAEEDTAVYHAVRALSEVKEDPHSTDSEVAEVQKKLDEAYSKVTYVSEAQALTRLSWWTTEYGLFKKDDRYLIYGAGLLSSIGESYNCLSDRVKKIFFDINCTKVGYDITRPQVQLFYTDDFKKLEGTIDEFASRMSFKIGGPKSLEKARIARTITTSQTETGLQLSGVLENFILNSKNEVCLLGLNGPAQIAISEKQVPNHGPAVYKNGFACALGNVDASQKNKLKVGQALLLDLDSGMKVEGVLLDNTTFAIVKNFKVTQNSKTLLASNDSILVIPFAKKITSVFGGAADRPQYLSETKSQFAKPRAPKPNITAKNKNLIPLYAEIRKVRESGILDSQTLSTVEKIIGLLAEKFPQDWLLRLEILELIKGETSLAEVRNILTQNLKDLATQGDVTKTLIKRGFDLVSE